jgi:hypothetical protein
MENKTIVIAALAGGIFVSMLTSAHADPQKRLGKLVALPVMAHACNLTITPEQTAAVDALAPKLQQEAGVSDDQLKDLMQSMMKDFNHDDCKGIADHWAQAVPALIEQAQSDQ